MLAANAVLLRVGLAPARPPHPRHGHRSTCCVPGARLAATGRRRHRRADHDVQRDARPAGGRARQPARHARCRRRRPSGGGSRRSCTTRSGRRSPRCCWSSSAWPTTRPPPVRDELHAGAGDDPQQPRRDPPDRPPAAARCAGGPRPGQRAQGVSRPSSPTTGSDRAQPVRPPTCPRWATTTELVLYRVAQESLTNIARHARRRARRPDAAPRPDAAWSCASATTAAGCGDVRARAPASAACGSVRC